MSSRSIVNRSVCPLLKIRECVGGQESARRSENEMGKNSGAMIELIEICMWRHEEPPDSCFPIASYESGGDCLVLTLQVNPYLTTLKDAHRAVYTLFEKEHRLLRSEERPLLLQFIGDPETEVLARDRVGHALLISTNTHCIATGSVEDGFIIRNHIPNCYYNRWAIGDPFPGLLPLTMIEDDFDIQVEMVTTSTS